MEEHAEMNPFKVLNVKKDASSQEIVQAAASALRTRTFPAVEIATAQKSLLDPAARAEMSFLYFTPAERLLAAGETLSPERAQSDASALKRLSVFD